MADINSGDDYLSGQQQVFVHSRSGARTTVANIQYTGRDLAGFPGVASNLTLANTPSGAIPDQTLPGVPPIEAFAGGAIGRLTAVRYTSNVPCYLRLIDRLYHVGSYTPNGTTNSITTPPSYSGRLPLYGGVANYRNLRVYAEVSTVIQNSACNLSAGYTDYDGVTARTTPTTNIQNFAVGRIIDLGHASGALGVFNLTSAIFSTTVTGAVNLFVGRTLWAGRVPGAGGGGIDDMSRTLRPQVWATSCIDLLVQADSTSFGQPEVTLEIVSK